LDVPHKCEERDPDSPTVTAHDINAAANDIAQNKLHFSTTKTGDNNKIPKSSRGVIPAKRPEPEKIIQTMNKYEKISSNH